MNDLHVVEAPILAWQVTLANINQAPEIHRMLAGCAEDAMDGLVTASAASQGLVSPPGTAFEVEPTGPLAEMYSRPVNVRLRRLVLPEQFDPREKIPQEKIVAARYMLSAGWQAATWPALKERAKTLRVDRGRAPEYVGSLIIPNLTDHNPSIDKYLFGTVPDRLKR